MSVADSYRTETGQLMTSMRPREDKAWDYLRPSEFVKKFIRFEERSPGIFELICLEGWPSKVLSNRPDGSYATKDLFLKHPSMEAYKYYARLDDTIVLVNGEKVNPLDMEGRVRQHNAVSEAVVFGSGKPSIGLVVIRAVDVRDMSDEEVVRAIWPTVEKGQEAMPAFGQLSKNMIRVVPADTTYPRTDKGTVIRQAFYRDFAELIEATYEAEDAGTGSLTLSEEELRDFIREQLQRLLPLKDQAVLTDDADFFGRGMDSLQATQLRSVLAKSLNTNGHRLGLNVAFEHPTINLLAHYLHSLASGETDGLQSVEDQMRDLIEKYSHFGRHIPSPNGLKGKYIVSTSTNAAAILTTKVVTGATGSLGSHIVAKLAALEDIQKIYCLVRSGSQIEAYDRLVQTMRTRRVYDTLSDVSRSKLIALPSDLSDPNLGLSPTTYTTLSSEITDTIHCAWSVNFNFRLRSFEKDSVASVKHLIDLCLRSQRPAPASFNFCSSISAAINSDSAPIPESLPPRLSHAQNMGYAQSKLVGEHICANAAASHPNLRARVLRIGQIIGDSQHGIWNPTEAIPLMLQCATTIGALPKLDDSPLWLPVDTVAETVSDIVFSPSQGCDIFNIIHPGPGHCHWTRDLLPYLRNAGLEFEELSQRDWIARLRSSNPDPGVNPPIKLVDFFAAKYDTDKLVGKGLEWDTGKAREISPAFRDARPLNQAAVDRMVGYFRAEWGCLLS